MNKPELISAMAEKSNLTKKDVEVALKSFIETVEDTLANKEKVQIVGFGTFEPRTRAAREGHNPRTKEKIQIPEKTTPAFKAGKEFKNKVANK